MRSKNNVSYLFEFQEDVDEWGLENDEWGLEDENSDLKVV